MCWSHKLHFSIMRKQQPWQEGVLLSAALCSRLYLTLQGTPSSLSSQRGLMLQAVG